MTNADNRALHMGVTDDFKPIIGTESEVFFCTAEYLASGYFHKSQITAVNHAKKTVMFRYKSWLDVRAKEKSYKTVTMDVYEFMAKMLHFLPKKHQKMIRYYGIYAHGVVEKLQTSTSAT
ncbi:MAG TPA: transposase [Spirochaetota bacterium]|nr:transposase [Spirochaetota bacterium]